MSEKKIQASTVIIITALLAAGLFLAVNIINDIYAEPSDASPNNLTADDTNVTVPTGLVINELMADNDRAVESVFGGHPDWLELYNSANQSVDLGGMYLSDSLTKGTWRIPNGTIIQAHSYLIVWADADAGQAPLQTNFNLKANGGAIGLFTKDRQTIVDFVLYEKQLRDVSYGRLPDGGSSWGYMTVPTAGKANVANPKSNTLASWEIWLFLILALAVLTVVAFRNRLHLRRKS